MTTNPINWAMYDPKWIEQESVHKGFLDSISKNIIWTVKFAPRDNEICYRIIGTITIANAPISAYVFTPDLTAFPIKVALLDAFRHIVTVLCERAFQSELYNEECRNMWEKVK